MSKHKLTKAQRKARAKYLKKIQGKVMCPASEVEKVAFRGDQSKRKPKKPLKPKIDYRKKRLPMYVVTAVDSYIVY